MLGFPQRNDYASMVPAIPLGKVGFAMQISARHAMQILPGKGTRA
jgi:hypothetical protein